METNIQTHDHISPEHLILKYPVVKTVTSHNRENHTKRWYDNKIYASSIINVFQYLPEQLRLRFGLDLLRFASHADRPSYKIDANGPITKDNVQLIFKTNYNKRWGDKIPILNVAFQHIENLPPESLKQVCTNFYGAMENYSIQKNYPSLTELFETLQEEQAAAAFAALDDHNLLVDIDFTSGKKHKK